MGRIYYYYRFDLVLIYVNQESRVHIRFFSQCIYRFEPFSILTSPLPFVCLFEALRTQVIGQRQSSAQDGIQSSVPSRFSRAKWASSTEFATL